MARKIYKQYEEQSERDEYWNQVSEDKMDQTFTRRSRVFTLYVPPHYLNREFTDKNTICDLGCAYAPQVDELGEQFDYLGIDPAEEIVKQTEEKYSGVPSARFENLSIQEAFQKYGEGSFDIVTFIGVFGTFTHEDSIVAISQGIRMARKCVLLTTLHPQTNPSAERKYSKALDHDPQVLMNLGMEYGFDKFEIAGLESELMPEGVVEIESMKSPHYMLAMTRS